MNSKLKKQIDELKNCIQVKRGAIESMCENLKYADHIAYSRDREQIKAARVMLRVMLDELEELKQEAGISFVPEKKAHTLKLFIYERLDPCHPDNKFSISTGELDLNFTDKQKLVFVGSCQIEAQLNEINKAQELEHIRHRDEMRMRFALEEKIKEQNYKGIRLNKKAS